MAGRVRILCRTCGEPTTHERRLLDGKETYICLMCEAGKERTEEDMERIRKSRKGWKVSID